MCSGEKENIVIDSDINRILREMGIRKEEIGRIVFSEGIKRVFLNFGEFTKLKTIEIPASVEEIDLHNIFLCECLNNINVSQDNKVFFSDGGVLYKKCGLSEDGKNIYKLIYYPAHKCGTEYTILDGTIAIGRGAFIGVNRGRITIPVSVKEIEKNAFAESCFDKRYDKHISITYMGTKKEWDEIKFGEGNKFLRGEIQFFKRYEFVEGSDRRGGLIFENIEELTIVDVDNVLEERFKWECDELNEDSDKDIDYEDGLGKIADRVSKVCLINIEKIGDCAFGKFEHLETVLFNKTKEKWNAIKKGKGNAILSEVRVECIDGVIEPKIKRLENGNIYKK